MLSILIPTLISRQKQCEALISELTRQSVGVPVTIIHYPDNRELSIGAKRQELLNRVETEYCVFFDDDDTPAPDYVLSIIEALKSKPDCVGFKGTMTTNGHRLQKWQISLRHKSWYNTSECYYRAINHLSPVKSDIAKKVGFKDLIRSEDYDYSMRLMPHLKTEVFIDKELYYYNYISKK